MAMMDFQNKGEQFNKTVEQLISLLMNQKLMKERLGGYKELEGMRGERGVELENLRQEGDMALQKQRHGDETTQIQQEFYNDLAQDTEANQLKALIFTGKREGTDVTGLIGDLDTRMKKVSASIANAYQGVTSPENIESMLNNLTDETLRKVFGVIGDERQRREVAIPRLGVEKYAAETSRGNLAVSWEKLEVDNVKDQSTNWLKTIHRTQDHLRTEGIKEEGGMGLGALKALIGGSGRMPDPLTPENRGAAYEWLAEIEGKLNDGVLPNEIDKRFLRTVKNTFRIQGTEVKTGERGSVVSSGIPGEGMPTPETGGFTPTEFGRQQSETADRAKAEKIAEMKSKIIASAIAQGFITQDQALQYDPYFQMKAEEEYAKEMALRQR